MNSLFFDREQAIKELTKGRELIAQLLVFLSSASIGDKEVETVVGDLSMKALHALSAAISSLNIKKKEKRRETKAIIRSNFQGDGRNKERRRANCWIKVTLEPYDDGYHWRKYSQKKIHNSLYPRNYYRCIYHNDLKCMATKKTQQQERQGTDSIFTVTYEDHHTCISILNADQFPSNVPGDEEASLLNFESNSNGSREDQQYSFLSSFGSSKKESPSESESFTMDDLFMAIGDNEGFVQEEEAEVSYIWSR